MKKHLLPLLLALSVCTYAQPSEKLLSFVKNANNFSLLYPQEKAYLHFDNTGYYLGEDIWFQAYVVGAQNLRPTEMSKVLYVELLSAEGELLEVKKLKIENGRADGYFLLKGDYYAGFYEVRAYTRCMLNFDEAGIFSRVFPVFNKPKKAGSYAEPRMTRRDARQSVDAERTPAPKYDKLNLAFFPEGGSLVQGVSCKVAFKATNSRGQSVAVHGTLCNAAGDALSTFSTLHDGMGFFDLVPDGQKYTVKVTHEGSDHSFALPAAEVRGYALRVDNLSQQQLRAVIAKSAATPTETVGVALLCRGKPCWFDTLNLSSEQPTLIAIPKSNLPSGVAQLTVFSERGEVLAERLLFVRNGEENLSIKPTVSASHKPLSPVSIGFRVTNAKDEAVQTTFSLAVYDAQTRVGAGDAGGIMANLLLSSEVKGYVNNAAFYFEKDTRAYRAALDLLLMVQGWRRYEWKTLSGVEPFSVKHWIEKGLLVDGAVLNLRKKPMKNVDVSMWLFSPDGMSQRGTCPTDENGRFNFLLEDFTGTANLHLMSKQKGKRVWSSITLDRDLTLMPRAYSAYETDLSRHVARAAESVAPAERDTADGGSSSSAANTHSADKAYELAELEITGKNRWAADIARYATIQYDVRKEQDKLRDKGEREQSGFLDFLAAKGYLMCTDTPLDESVVREELSFGATYQTTCTYKGRPVQWVVNGGEGENIDFVEAMNRVYPVNELLADDVERVIIDEEGRTCYGCQTTAGSQTIIYVYTNKDGKRREENKGIRLTTFQGYSAPSEFYSPAYEGFALPDKQDFRRTLYWNPNVQTDAQGNATVQLYNNSTATELGISAETLTGDGLMGGVSK